MSIYYIVNVVYRKYVKIGKKENLFRAEIGDNF